MSNSTPARASLLAEAWDLLGAQENTRQMGYSRGAPCAVRIRCRKCTGFAGTHSQNLSQKDRLAHFAVQEPPSSSPLETETSTSASLSVPIQREQKSGSKNGKYPRFLDHSLMYHGLSISDARIGKRAKVPVSAPPLQILTFAQCNKDEGNLPRVLTLTGRER